MTDKPTRLERAARLRWVPISKMRVSAVAQREQNPARVSYLAANLDLEQIGYPVVSERDGWFWIMDGGHRVQALIEHGWGDQQIQCQVYTGLSEEEEAERFLKLNNTLSVSAFVKFQVAVQAGREVECDIDRVVRAQGLRVSREKIDGAVRAVATLRKVYTKSDPATLGRTLRILRDAYGDPGLDGPTIEGIGLLCQRYNGELDDAEAVKKLAGVLGGLNGLVNKANKMRIDTGNAKAHCIAAAAVEIINSGRAKTKQLPSWWRTEA